VAVRNQYVARDADQDSLPPSISTAASAMSRAKSTVVSRSMYSLVIRTAPPSRRLWRARATAADEGVLDVVVLGAQRPQRDRLADDRLERIRQVVRDQNLILPVRMSFHITQSPMKLQRG